MRELPKDPFQLLDFETYFGRWNEPSQIFADPTKYHDFCQELSGRAYPSGVPNYVRAAIIGEEGGLREDLLMLVKLAVIYSFLHVRNPIAAAIMAEKYEILTPSGFQWRYKEGDCSYLPDSNSWRYSDDFRRCLEDFEGYFRRIFDGYQEICERYELRYDKSNKLENY